MLKPQTPKINWGNPLTQGLIFNLGMIGTNSTEKDLVGGNDLTYVNTPTAINNTVGRGIQFVSGSNQYAKRGVISTKINNFTMEVLFTMDVLQSQTLFCLGIDSSNGYKLRYSGSGTTFQFTTEGGAGPSIRTNTVPALRVLYHLVGVWDNGVRKIYLQGKDDTNAAENTAPATPTVNTTIAGALDVTPTLTDQFSGQIFKVSYYNRPLKPYEIRRLALDPFQIYVKPNIPPFISPTAAVVASTQNPWLKQMGVGQ